MPLTLPPQFFQLKPVKESSIFAGVTNTWYDGGSLVAAAKTYRVYYVAVRQSNGEAAAKNLEVELTIDGVVPYVYGGSCANQVFADAWLNHRDGYAQMASQVDSVTNRLVGAGGILPIDCKALGVRIRNISAAGTNQDLRAMIIYGESA